MYRTSEGVRVLRGAEAAVFIDALGMIVDMMQELPMDLGVSAFDNLQYGQKLVVLQQLADALLDEKVPPPPLNSCLEGAVAAIYLFIEDLVCQECMDDVIEHRSQDPAEREEAEEEMGDLTLERRNDWRTMVRNACAETNWGDDLPSVDSTDEETWMEMVQHLANRILWDRDFEMEDVALDVDPARLQELKQLMGIDADYYVAVPPEPADRDHAAITAKIRKRLASVSVSRRP